MGRKESNQTNKQTYATTSKSIVFFQLIANSADPDEKPQYVMKRHNMWHFIWVFTLFQSTRLRVSGLQRINIKEIF